MQKPPIRSRVARRILSTLPIFKTISSGFKADDYTTYPYVNLGDLVLDGRGSTEAYTDTKFTDDEADKAATPMGYTYTIQSYQNGGCIIPARA